METAAFSQTPIKMGSFLGDAVCRCCNKHLVNGVVKWNLVVRKTNLVFGFQSHTKIFCVLFELWKSKFFRLYWIETSGLKWFDVYYLGMLLLKQFTEN